MQLTQLNLTSPWKTPSCRRIDSRGLSARVDAAFQRERYSHQRSVFSLFRQVRFSRDCELRFDTGWFRKPSTGYRLAAANPYPDISRNDAARTGSVDDTQL